METQDIHAEQAWTTNIKTLFDMVIQDWQSRVQADRELRAKLDNLYMNREQELSSVNALAARTSQVQNAVTVSALIESVMGRATLEEPIAAKLAAEFPASVTESVVEITDKLVNMVGVDALLAIVQAVAQGKATTE